MSAPPRVFTLRAARSRAAVLLRQGRVRIECHRWLASPHISRAAVAVVAAGALLRVALVFAGWPASDSDESTMGIMALHIAGRSDFPIFFYGQRYIGTIEAYLAAGAFQLFGPSLVTLRLGMLLLAALWLGCMYALARALYPFAGHLRLRAARHRLARGALSRTVGGGRLRRDVTVRRAADAPCHLARPDVQREIGDRAPARPQASHRIRRLGARHGPGRVERHPRAAVRPHLGSAARGSSAGASGVALPCLLGGLALGTFPLLIYAISAPDHNPLAGAFAVQRSSNASSGNVPALLAGQVTGTLLVALPAMTGGGSLCALPASESWPLAHASPHTLLCTSIHGLWGAGYIALLVVALVTSVRAVRRLRAGEMAPDEMAPDEMAPDEMAPDEIASRWRAKPRGWHSW